ncbi:TetR/AcrR family transcriptional regulator [Streptomonospora nanhaiensis]|uniref:TetR/AcrR family transcriptional regulator n=1 Tax=Streptomonospora nanhaiensis TaxID=1323731 RepID=UPI001C99E527|nr:TetR/AcrR family transcriptional regulator [Streptomonospora nanhaiensis]MBX9391907.1 transcriptional regulator [Streptomonospora nanhaiensis]
MAAAAPCALPSLHTVFHGRDGLLAAVFERYGPVVDVEALAAAPPERLEDMVRGVQRAVVHAFAREPRVVPAIFADLLARPQGPGTRLLREAMPRVFSGISALLRPEIAAGRVRPLPMPVLFQLIIGPPVVHMMTRPALEAALGEGLPPVEESLDHFAAAFLRAAAPGGAG